MPVNKTRDSNGRFASSNSSTSKSVVEEILENPVPTLPVQRNTIIFIIKVAVIILVVWPWLVLAFRKNAVENISKKITDFYDDNFSCNSYCSSLSFISQKNSTEKDKF
jgi:hypothetical protein